MRAFLLVSWLVSWFVSWFVFRLVLVAGRPTVTRQAASSVFEEESAATQAGLDTQNPVCCRPSSAGWKRQEPGATSVTGSPTRTTPGVATVA
jgi:hypothetical protein